jgi:hypothetical protein
LPAKASAWAGKTEGLFIPLFMTVLSESFLTLVRRNFMTLPFFTARHVDP